MRRPGVRIHAVVAVELGGRLVCATCEGAVAEYSGRLEHRRGRIPGVSPYRREVLAGDVDATVSAARRAELERGRAVAERLNSIDFDGDRCECGTLLAEHPPLERRPRVAWTPTAGLTPRPRRQPLPHQRIQITRPRESRTQGGS